jgi:hypothetical protein
MQLDDSDVLAAFLQSRSSLLTGPNSRGRRIGQWQDSSTTNRRQVSDESLRSAFLASVRNKAPGVIAT